MAVCKHRKLYVSIAHSGLAIYICYWTEASYAREGIGGSYTVSPATFFGRFGGSDVIMRISKNDIDIVEDLHKFFVVVEKGEREHDNS